MLSGKANKDFFGFDSDEENDARIAQASRASVASREVNETMMEYDKRTSLSTDLHANAAKVEMELREMLQRALDEKSALELALVGSKGEVDSLRVAQDGLQKEIARLQTLMSNQHDFQDSSFETDTLAMLQKKEVVWLEKVEERTSKLTQNDSELLGVSLKWVFCALRDAVWERIVRKQESQDNLCEGERLWNDLKPENMKDLTFIDLKFVLACGPTGIGKGRICPRDNQRDCSIVDGLHSNGDSSKATVFMSWVWAYTVEQVLSALESWHFKENEDQQLAHHSVWWCFMSNNQYRLQSTIEDSTTLARIFGERLTTIGRMVIVLDRTNQPTYVTRCWCLFEVWKVIQERMKNDVTVALSSDGLEELRLNARSHKVNLDQCLAIDSRNAKASNEMDRAFIMEQMEGKHDEVGRVVKEQLLTLFRASLRDWMPETTTLDQRIKDMIERLEMGRNVEQFKNKELVVFIGNTGSGKSTTINFLHGCEMEIEGYEAKNRVRVAEDSTVKEVAAIGHTNSSKTEWPDVTEIRHGEDILYCCDCPGFVDQRGRQLS